MAKRPLTASVKLYEPTPRWAHHAVPVGGRLYIWGGRTKHFDKEKTASLEMFDPYLEIWTQCTARGTTPKLYHGACISSGEMAYMYGGWDGQSYQGVLSQLNTAGNEWTQLLQHGVDVPMKKVGSRIVFFDGDKLASLGGVGGHHNGWTNELHIYNLKNGTYTSPTLIGTRPPPCSHFSLNMMDHHRAVLFGGRQKHGRTNDVYIIDFKTMHCSKLEVQEGEPQPVGRSAHAAVCLDYDGEHPQLLVTSGRDNKNKVLRDAWILDILSGRWREVVPPYPLQPRCQHSTTAISLAQGLVDVIMFGGWPECPSNVKRDSDYPMISDTTILRFESIQSPSSYGSSSTREWILTDVANNSQRGSTERLREKMSKIRQATHQSTAKLQITTISQSDTRNERESIRKLEHRVQQAEERANQVERRAVEEADRRVQEANVKADRRVQEATVKADRRVQEANVEADGRVQECIQRKAEAENRLQTITQSLEQRIHILETQWAVQRDEIQLTGEELGRGGWAAVRIAKFRGIDVAAKLFYDQIHSRHNRQLFRREMNMAARVRHPNLVQFIGATLEGDMIILTELMPTSLRKELKKEDCNFSHDQVISISLDVAKALNYLHLMQPDPIIHRDISSANILLEPLPSNHWRAKVTDYGSVNVLEQLQTVGPGSPVYAAPESEKPSQQTPKMDIFSFGALLLEILTLELPAKKDRDRLIDSVSVSHPQFVALIRQCLQEDRKLRPSASDIIQQICSF